MKHVYRHILNNACLGFCFVSVLISSCASIKHPPPLSQYSNAVGERAQLSPDFFTLPNGKLRKNTQGLWELYVAGDALERGLANGVLTEELLYQQEDAFVSKISELVPSKFRQWALRGFLKFFNRRLIAHVPEEYQVELYGLSRSSSVAFNFIAPPYQRLLYFHGAHDIGHALQDLALVGCTSFAAWGAHTEDGKLLIGRNFDFYAGDAFSEEKIVAFVNPSEGYKYAMVTWAGMVGVVSGMNEHGLTVTINAGKSDLPLKAKTPVSLVTKEILQYATTIDEAIDIAKDREVFVSESIMVGSARDGKAVLVEVSPKKFGVYEVEHDADLLVCSNHFQSQPYQADRKNLRHIAESHSQYRFDRVHELVASNPPLTPALAASFLRNTNGIHETKLGYGNEKAINQLLAHHAVIFQPEDRRMWVSSHPYQLGTFVAYDLEEVFKRFPTMSRDTAIAIGAWNISEDAFVHSVEFRNYEAFRVEVRELEAKLAAKETVDEEELAYFEQLNPDLWKTHFLVGEYYFGQRNYVDALRHYRLALQKEVTTLPDRLLIEKRINKCERKAD